MTESPHDVVLGKLALSAGLLSKEELEACRGELRKLREEGAETSLAQILVARGLASQEQLVNLAKSAAERAKAGTARSSSEHPVPPKDAAAAAEATATTEEEAKLAAQARAAVEAREKAMQSSGAGSDPSASGSASDSHSARQRAADDATPATEPEKEAATGSSEAESKSGSGTQSKPRQSPIEGYEITQKLGSGAMGAVYKARHKETGRRVALKVLPPKLAKNPSYVERFQREARAAKRLQHENIVGAYDIGESNGLFFFAMEFVEGKTVRDMLEEQRAMPEGEALMIVRQVASALIHASEQEIVHRDIKPDNIMVATDGIAKLCDMGLAKHVTADPELTMHGAAVGTPWYISPEQARGERQIDTRADIYSLGATLYHMVAGGPPYIGATAAVIMTRHINDPIPDPRRGKPHLSAGLVAVIHHMMAKNRDERYQSPKQVIEDIDAILFGDEPKYAPTVALPQKDAAKAASPGSAAAARTGKPGASRGSRSAGSTSATKRRSQPQSARQAAATKAARTSKRTSAASSRRMSSPARASDKKAPRRWMRDLGAFAILGVVAGGLVIVFTSLGNGDADPTPGSNDQTHTTNGEEENGTDNGIDVPGNGAEDEERVAAVQRYAADKIAEARELIAANRIEAALEQLNELVLEQRVREDAPAQRDEARELYRATHQEASAEAERALERARDRMDREGMIRGDEPNFREALRLLDEAVPEHLRFLVEQRIESRRDSIQRAAATWLSNQRARFAESLAADEFDEAEQYLNEAQRIVLPHQRREISPWADDIVEARRRSQQREAQETSRLAREAFEALLAQVELPLSENRLEEARQVLVEGLEDERIQADEEVARLLRLEIEAIEGLQRFWQAVLDHARIVETTQATLGLPEERTFTVREVRTVEQRLMRQLGGTDVTLEIVHPDTGRTRSIAFSTLDVDYAHALGEAGLNRAGASRLDRIRAEAAFLVFYRPPQAPERVHRVLSFLHGEEALEELPPNVVEDLEEMARQRRQAEWEALMQLVESTLAEPRRDTLEQAASQLRDFRIRWERVDLLESGGEVDRWSAGALEHAEQLLERFGDDAVDAALAERLRAEHLQRLDDERIEVEYRFESDDTLEAFDARTPGDSRIETMPRGGLRITAPRTGSTSASLAWGMSLADTFELELTLRLSQGASMFVNVYHTGVLADCYTLPLGVQDPQGNSVPFGLYFGRWRNFLSQAAPPDALVVEPAVELGQQEITLRIERTHEGHFRIELDSETLNARHRAVEAGQLQIVVPRGEVELTRMRYRGPLTD